MIEHVRDFRRVKKLSDAFPPEGHRPWTICISRDVYYMIEVEDGEDIGAWLFEPNDEGYLMHSAMGPKCRGKKAVQSGLSAIGLLFDLTDCEKVIAVVPIELRHAHVIPRQAGFKFVCIDNGCRCSILHKSDYYGQKRAA